MGNFRDNIRRVEPYVPGEQPKRLDVIKLNTNENPYPPAPGVTAVREAFSDEQLRLYPDPASHALTSVLADRYGLDEDQVFVGVGSDDVLAMAFLTFFNSDKPILFPDITYSFYSVWADLFRIPYERPALDEEFRLVKEDYYRDNGGIIFPNPNAPTSLLLPTSLWLMTKSDAAIRLLTLPTSGNAKCSCITPSPVTCPMKPSSPSVMP